MPKYQAFISYSRAADSRLAPEIKAALQRFAKPWYKLRAIHVFCDQTNLTANPDLWGSIEKQIDDTEYFIYLASPKAAASKWVQKELHRFYSNGKADKIIIVLTDGNIAWDDANAAFDWSRTDAMPNTTDAYFRQEPTWLDLTWIRKEQLSTHDPRFLDAIANLSAAIRNIDKDVLIGKDVEEHRKAKRFRLLSMTGLALLALFLLIAAWFAIRSEKRSQERLVRTYVGNGVGLLEAGDNEMSFPWFVQALVNERDNDKEELHKFRIESLFSQTPQLVQVWNPERLVLQTDFLDNNRVLIITGPSEDWNSFEFECMKAKNGDCHAAIRLVNTETGEDVYKPIRLSDGIRAARVSANKKLLASFSLQNMLRLWNLENGSLLWEKKIDALVTADAFLCRLAFNLQDSKLLLSYPVGQNGSKIDVFDLAAGNLEASCKEPNYTVINPHFLGNGDSVIFLSEGLKIWNIKRTESVLKRTPYFNQIDNYELSPDARHLALSGYRDKKDFQGFGASVVSIVVYAAIDSLQKPIFTKEFDFSPNRLRFDEGGNVLGINSSSTTEAGSYDEGSEVLDVVNGNPLTGLVRRSQEVTIDFDRTGKKLVLSCRDGTTEVWEVGEPGSFFGATQRLYFLHDGTQRVGSIFSPDGRYLLTSGQLIKLWKLPQDSAIQTIIDQQEFEREVADTTVQWYVTYGQDSEDTTAKETEAYVFEKGTNKKTATLKHGDRVYQAVLSPDGNLVATAAEGTLFVWSRANSQLQYKIPAPNNSAVESIAFSPDSKRLVVAFFDFSLRVWDALKGVPVSPYMTHVISTMDNIWVMFSKDGKKILSTDKHTSSRVWDAATGDLLCAPTRVDLSIPEDSVGKSKRINSIANWKHPLSSMSLGDLQNYAELISNQQLEENGSFAPISMDAFLTEWKAWKAAFKK